MCGIFGWIAPNGLQLKYVHEACTIIKHRGPDGDGYFSWNGNDADSIKLFSGNDTPPGIKKNTNPIQEGLISRVALGHRRLSIVDLSDHGHQPMGSADGKWWISYNGEIYNYIELRKELEHLGCEFISKTDTEIILHAWKVWGESCLERFNGMFSFLLIDIDRKRLHVVRDRFGIKPLFCWSSPNKNLFFASEIKSFTVLPGWRARMNRQRVYDMLNWRLLDHTTETCFKDVRQISPGSFLSIDIRRRIDQTETGNPISKRWYKIQPERHSAGFSEIARGYGGLFSDAVGIRLRSDVPVGFCLSGGLDSSAIVCSAVKRLGRRGNPVPRTYTAGSTDSDNDETGWANQVSAHAKTNGTVIYPNQGDFWKSLQKIVWHHEEPFDSHGIFAYWQMMNTISGDGMKVVLNGQGADEQFGGYKPFIGARLGGLLRYGNILKLLHEIVAFSKSQRITKNELWLRTIENALPTFMSQYLRHFSGAANARPDWINYKKLGIRPVDPFIHLNARNVSVNTLGLAQLTGANLQMLLHYEDRLSMAHSVEVRVPFLDYRLVNFTMGLPENFKINNGILKHLLKEAMKGVLPEPVRTRPDKKGFPTPIQQWMCHTDRDAFRRQLSVALGENRDFFNAATKKTVDGVLSGRRPFSLIPWRILNFHIWRQTFNVE